MWWLSSSQCNFRAARTLRCYRALLSVLIITMFWMSSERAVAFIALVTGRYDVVRYQSRVC